MYPLTAATAAILLVAACSSPAADAAPRANFKGAASVAQFSHLAGSGSDSPLLVKRGNRATHYDVGLGACGSTNSNAELVVALNAPQFGNVPGSSPWCGKCIAVTNGKTTAVARVVDKCPGCPDRGLDMSPSLFQHFAELGAGVIDVTWQEVPCGGGAPAPAPEPKPAPAPAPAPPQEEPKPAPAPARPEPQPVAAPSPSPAAPAPAQENEWKLGTPAIFKAPEPKATPAPSEPKKEEPKKEEPRRRSPSRSRPRPRNASPIPCTLRPTRVIWALSRPTNPPWTRQRAATSLSTPSVSSTCRSSST
ncbi:RlpA-like double-psi beta-barrel-protein domain-containing protein-containing protein [Catenaria anguillulae PL171]|uniref:RlpA-like double-psi beta-barrel-protein domain-containing protein-containing protein n=1 Tax=Catenaria anguillulae PL171 TaxID=765915 RepID=A0A1Y2I4H8_9FUNG|nr:RlpA-like double-psi beta-barrel-protein domain-containing protein-containing protein [Catenaria anguillulae PL171]